MPDVRIPAPLVRLNAAAEYLNHGGGKVNSRAAGLVTVHQRDLQWLLKRHHDADSALERLEQATAALMLDIEDGASIRMNQNGNSWAAFQSLDALLEHRMKLRRLRRHGQAGTTTTSKETADARDT